MRHATTGEIFTIAADELEWAEFAADERQMGKRGLRAALRYAHSPG